jgi:2-polyprenyl-3-methyl-5-hydroxy-6-metoxy-1,4-benzoquinol methylase
MNFEHQSNNDFRVNLYSRYISKYKKFIGNEDTGNIKSDYKVYKKWYLSLLRSFSKNANIIELGCGSGYILQFLKHEGFQNLYGIDISVEQIEKAKAKGLNTDVKSVFDFFETNKTKYDIVLALDFIEHFEKNELLNLFAGINKILNENGILIIRTPNGQGLFPGRNIYGDLTHLTIFNPNSLTQILHFAGFYDIKFYETGPVIKNLKGFIRFILWQTIRIFIKAVRIVETGGSEKIYTQDFICTCKKSI